MNKLIGFVCCLASLNAFGADKANVEIHDNGFLSSKDVTITIPKGERISDIQMGCTNGRCYHTIITIKKGQSQNPYTYILRTYSASLNDGVTTIKETE